ncbi:hypothetical protein MMC16_004903 [Acarospora aff. strigata]|nr:hypothetical protein [Acarospora aff. strigata]
MSTTAPPPLTGLRVLEFAGLAPGPFCGLLLADHGATVLRIDLPTASSHTDTPNPNPTPTPDLLTRHKTSIALNLKDPSSRTLLLSLIPTTDILIDPFRPGVLETSLHLPPALLQGLNPRLIIARLTGFRRDGKYSAMAGHDINYLAVSGVLSQLGPKWPAAPSPPVNILGDFAGGGMACFAGIVLALVGRGVGGRGQVVEANMVDGVAYLGTMVRLGKRMGGKGVFRAARGENLLDGGCPYYACYECRDRGRYMAVGALEERFWRVLVKGLGVEDEVRGLGRREDRATWEALRRLFERKFREMTRVEWERVFDGTDACCTPVLEQEELEEAGYEQRAVVTLKDTPALEIGANDGGWVGRGLSPGEGGEKTLQDWMGWKRDRDYRVEKGGLVKVDTAKL